MSMSIRSSPARTVTKRRSTSADTLADDYDMLLKVVMVGDSGVGKSSLLSRFSDGRFCESHLTTIGVDFGVRTVDIDGKRIKVQVWDTAGQDRFKAIARSYYHGADGVLLCYDVSEKETLDSALNMWRTEVDTYAKRDVRMMLVGNKTDLAATAADPVTDEDVRDALMGEDMPLMKTSAKDDAGVGDAFVSIVRAAMLEKLSGPVADIDTVKLPTGKTVGSSSCCSMA
eukprot:PLAT14626.1.p1 GENE.PLAT14626.1~~PLAT14626.1.p1  ORF type:complete len:228 (-),score=100.43 PLAT14626.1:110-793(-)